MYAAETGEAETLEMLVQAGADMALRNSMGQTALEIAEMKGNEECLAILQATPSSQEKCTPASAPTSSSAGATSKKTGRAQNGAQAGAQSGPQGGQRICAGCELAKAKKEFSKNQWLKGAGVSRCSDCVQLTPEASTAAPAVGPRLRGWEASGSDPRFLNAVSIIIGK